MMKAAQKFDAVTLVVWLIEKCPVTPGFDARRVGPCIKRYLERLGYSGPLTITALGLLTGVPVEVLRGVSSTGIRLHIDPFGSKSVSSHVFNWTDKNPPPANIMVITDPGDRDTYLDLHLLEDKFGYNIIKPYRFGPAAWKSFLLAESLGLEDECIQTGEYVWRCTVCDPIKVHSGFKNFARHISSEEHAHEYEAFFPEEADEEYEEDEEADEEYEYAQASFQRKYPTTMSKGRASFPKGFLFGTASSSYQLEGAFTEGERGQSMWDHFTNRFPHRISDSSDSNVAVDFFHRYKEDIQRMKDINMDSFRLSISWQRVIPCGKRERGVSEEGIKFYNDVIDELLANEITPLVTIFQGDIPQDLEDEYGGFLSGQIIDDFRDYASLCFERFGDRVSLWCTLNEPWVYSVVGYDTGRIAPGRCSKYVNGASVAGMSGYEEYQVSHNMLLAHAEAAQVFRKCDHIKNGQIGIAHNPLWYEPYDPSDPDDVAGCNRAMDFMIGWHHHPTVYGDYPETMKKWVGDRLPSFTREQSKKLIGSCDYLGINYYSSLFVKSIKNVDPTQPTWRTDQGVDWMKTNIDGKQIAKQGGSEWSFTYPTGLRNVLKYMKKNYENPRILITENGYGEVAEKSQNLYMYNPSIDTERLEYLEGHINAIHQAIHEDGVRVEGYYVCSLLDNFDWNSGYGVRYGLYYIDGLRRYPKMSALWLKEFLKFDQGDELLSSSESKKEEKKKKSYGKQLLHSIKDSGALPAVLGSLFVVAATVGTSRFFKGSNN